MKKGFTIVEVSILFVIFLIVAILVAPMSLDDTTQAKNTSRWRTVQQDFSNIFLTINNEKEQSNSTFIEVVDKDKILDNSTVEEGDVIIALPSSGVHSNGFSLVRKVLDVENGDITSPLDDLGGKSIGETLLTPTRIYVKPVLALIDAVKVKALSHITGGGFYENIPRSLPEGYCAKIDKSSLKILPIFDLIAKRGNIPERDMFNTFNMGVGMSIVVSKADSEKALEVLKAAGEDTYVIGEIVKGNEGVII